MYILDIEYGVFVRYVKLVQLSWPDADVTHLRSSPVISCVSLPHSSQKLFAIVSSCAILLSWPGLPYASE